ncbi:MAG: hypothetical protein ACREDK_00610 [Thermoplasmata archaeon]
MIELPRWFWVGVVIVGLAAAGWAGGNLSTAVPAATLAAIAAAALAAQELWPKVRRPVAPLPPLSGDPLVALRDAFTTGRLGRQTIVATIATLHRELGHGTLAHTSAEDERRLLDLPASEFRAWVEGEVARLERGT